MNEEAKTPAPMKVDDLVEKYIKLRDKRSRLKAQFQQEDAPLSELQDKIEALLLAKFDEIGIESSRTAAGTAYVETRTSAGLADWDAFKSFLDQQESPFDYVERRVSKAAVDAYRKATDGDLPPGINWTATRVVNVRRPRAQHNHE